MPKKSADIRDVKFRLVGEHTNLFIPRARALLRRAQETVFPAQQSVHIKEHGIEYVIQQYHGQYIVDIIKQITQPDAPEKEDKYHWFVGIPVAEQVMLDASSPATWVASGFGISGFNADFLNKEFPHGIYGAYKYAFWRYDSAAKKIVCSIKPYKELLQSEFFDGGRYCISNAKSDPAYGERYYRKGDRIISWLFTHSWAGTETNFVGTYGFPPGYVLQNHLPSPDIFENGHIVYSLPQDKFNLDVIDVAGEPVKLGYSIVAAAIDGAGRYVSVAVVSWPSVPCFTYLEGLPFSLISGGGFAVVVDDVVLVELNPETNRLLGPIRFYASNNGLATSEFPLSIDGVVKWTKLVVNNDGFELIFGDGYIEPYDSFSASYKLFFTSTLINSFSESGTTYPSAAYFVNAIAGCGRSLIETDVATNPPCGISSYGVAFFTNNLGLVQSSKFVGSDKTTIQELSNASFTQGFRSVTDFSVTPAFDTYNIEHKGRLLGTTPVDISYKYNYTHNLTGNKSGVYDKHTTLRKPLNLTLQVLPLTGCGLGVYKVWYVGDEFQADSYSFTDDGLSSVDFYKGMATPVETFKIDDEFSSTIIYDHLSYVGGTHTVTTNVGFNASFNPIGIPVAPAPCGTALLSQSTSTTNTFGGNDYNVTGNGELLKDIIHPNLHLKAYLIRTVHVGYTGTDQSGTRRVITDFKQNGVLVSHTDTGNVPYTLVENELTVTITYELNMFDTKLLLFTQTKTYSSSDYTNLPTAFYDQALQTGVPFSLTSSLPASTVYTTSFQRRKHLVRESNERDINPRFSCVYNDIDKTAFVSIHDDYICGQAQRLDTTTENIGALMTYNMMFLIDEKSKTFKELGDPIKALIEYTSEEKNTNALWRMEGNYPWVYKLGII